MPPPEQNTRQATIDRLDEVTTRLTQGHSSLAQNLAQIQATTNVKFDSILKQLAAITIVPSSPSSSPIPTSPFFSQPHMKLDVPRLMDTIPSSGSSKFRSSLTTKGSHTTNTLRSLPSAWRD